MNLTKELKDLKVDLTLFKEDFMKPINKQVYRRNHRTNIEELRINIGTLELIMSNVLDAIIALYKREDKQVIGVPSSKDYIQHRKALDSMVFTKEGDIVHLQIHEDMDKSSYRIINLDNRLKAERL
jgi:hypothetical protein